MDDERVRAFETDLWVGEGDVYRRRVSPECLMVLPEPPFLMSGRDAVEAVERTPRWQHVELGGLRITRPAEGLIVLAYRVEAARGEETYRADCSSTYLRLGHDHWQVVQHQQALSPPATLQRAADVEHAPAGASDSQDGTTEQAQRDAAENREDERGYQ